MSFLVRCELTHRPVLWSTKIEVTVQGVNGTFLVDDVVRTYPDGKCYVVATPIIISPLRQDDLVWQDADLVIRSRFSPPRYPVRISKSNGMSAEAAVPYDAVSRD